MAEQETFVSKTLQKTLKGHVKKSLLALKEEQKAVELQITELIETDARLKELFDLMVSVPGIGPVIATELLITTNEMQTISDPKKLACHAGVAPFEYRSGSSIRTVGRCRQNEGKSSGPQTAQILNPHGGDVGHPDEGGSSGLLPA